MKTTPREQTSAWETNSETFGVPGAFQRGMQAVGTLKGRAATGVSKIASFVADAARETVLEVTGERTRAQKEWEAGNHPKEGPSATLKGGGILTSVSTGVSKIASFVANAARETVIEVTGARARAQKEWEAGNVRERDVSSGN